MIIHPYLDLPDGPIRLDGFGLADPPFHVFQSDDVEAVNAALAAGRPLLLRGEPGAGKSQLARAAAKRLGRAFVSKVIDVRTEASDLQWHFDAVRRLADAQVMGAERRELREHGEADPLDEANYTAPGPLWWAFDWTGATTQAKNSQCAPPLVPEDCSPKNGVVVLLDEIDKADSSVPNGLLESLGDGRFPVPGGGVVKRSGVDPLVIITTNEERTLPDAFLRRCLVHTLTLPDDRQALFELLVARGRAHFGEGAQQEDGPPHLDDTILGDAAKQLIEDRRKLRAQGLAAPGGAEYLDLLRILYRRRDTTEERQDLLEVVARYVLDKHPPGTMG